jgi:hypothetical protein
MKSYTPEQNAVIQRSYNKDDTIAIKAYAGCGKTTILVELTKSISKKMPSWKGLYLAYNKDIVVEAKQKFPRTVTVVTTHQLAYASVGTQYREAGKMITDPYKTSIKTCVEYILRKIISKEIEASSEVYLWCSRYIVDWGLTNIAWLTVNKYTQSADREINENNIPYSYMTKLGIQIPDAVILTIAKNIWNVMISFEDSFPLTHDGYLKLYQLKGMDLGKHYDYIMYDEAQDANAATLDIVNRASSCKFYVGDPHQQIYSWRGSCNAFDNIENITEEYRLSYTFRFPPYIAGLATKILKSWKDEDVPLSSTITNDIVDPLITPGVHIVYPGSSIGMLKRTVLTRTNAKLFDNAAICLAKKIPFGFSGGKPSDLLQDVLDVHYLSEGKKAHIKNSFIRTFDAVKSLAAYAAGADDVATQILLSVTARYGKDIPNLVNKIMIEAVPENKAVILLTTAHRSKGLEWDVVEVSTDFVDTFIEADNRKNKQVSKNYLLPTVYSFSRTEEANLLYVACTRAKKALYIPEDINILIENHYRTKLKE